MTLSLYLMRHGQASQLASTDADRALTETGRRDVVNVVEARSQALGTVQVILASPYRRARETAALAIKTLDFSGQLLVCDELRPDGNIAALVEFIEQLGVSSVLLATHQPLIGEMAAALTGDPHAALTGDPQLRAMNTAWLLALQTEALAPGFARLLWVQTPPV